MEILTVPRILREKLGEDETESLIELLNKSNSKQKDDVLSFVVDKFERRLSEESSKLQVELSKTRADIIKWMFIFWVGQIGVLLGIIFGFLS
ncbi:MAG: hypothetical protein GF353_20240 [Candidatus Lokiarchaeota archaeon]|nr:hypothetical protein [Candidatus Lokiarchaeota archaeon]